MRHEPIVFVAERDHVVFAGPTALGGGYDTLDASVVAILLASFPSAASAQVRDTSGARANQTLPLPERALNQNAAWYRAITGTDPREHRLHRRN